MEGWVLVTNVSESDAGEAELIEAKAAVVCGPNISCLLCLCVEANVACACALGAVSILGAE